MSDNGVNICQQSIPFPIASRVRAYLSDNLISGFDSFLLLRCTNIFSILRAQFLLNKYVKLLICKVVY